MVHLVKTQSVSALDAVRSYVNSTAATAAASTATGDAMDGARDAAAEYGLVTPDGMTGEFLTFLAAQVAGQVAGGRGRADDAPQPSAVVMSPACGVIGLHLFAGLGPRGHVTCIDPEVDHQRLARETFGTAGLRPTSFRFLPSAPLDVVSRLASDAYDIIVSESAEEHLSATVEATLPALRPGGTLVLLDSLADGLVGDDAPRDRHVAAAREADDLLTSWDRSPRITVSRLPLGAGTTLVTKA